MDGMALAYLMAAVGGVSIAANRDALSVAALVDAGYLTTALEPTEDGRIVARLVEGVFKDVSRSVARMKARS